MEHTMAGDTPTMAACPVRTRPAELVEEVDR